MMSLVTSFSGGLPEGGVTFGSVASGPLVGVFAVGFAPAVARALSLGFSLPIVIVLLLLLLEPQPAISPVALSVASASTARERSVEEALELVTVAQPT